MYGVYLCKLSLLLSVALLLSEYVCLRLHLHLCRWPCNVEGISASQPYSFRCEFKTSTSTFTKEYGFTLNPNIAKRHRTTNYTHRWREE